MVYLFNIIIIIYLFELEIIKPNKMKKNLLSLRKLGLVLVAAGSMAMYSCGGAEEHVEDAAAHAEEAVTEVAEEVVDVADEATCGGGDMEGETTCGGGDMEGEADKCDGGKCGDSHDAEGTHAEGDHDHSEEGHEH